jgi:nitrous oxide reductase
VRELTDLELSILMVLADNKGHALWELVELLGKEKSNLIITLNRLEEEMELTNFSKIGDCDIIDRTYFRLKFREPKDPLSQYIRDQFKPGSKSLFDPDLDDFGLSSYLC